MEDLNFYTLNAIFSESRNAASSYELYAARKAWRLYNQARMMATLRGFWMRFTRKSNRLRALNTVSQRIPADNTRYAGMRAVPLVQIRGSETRLDDFDASFNPLQQHNQDRWLNVAMANLRGVTMPPVESGGRRLLYA
jgi:hypothetical protein